MQNELNVAIIQTSLVWEDPESNRNNFEEKIGAISEPVDLIILPEMFASGFTMHAKSVAETMTGPTVSWMIALAKQYDTAISGSLVIEEQGHYFNRLLLVYPDGQIQHYDKKHTFTLASEHQTYTAGKQLLIIDYKGWRIKPLVCYDLRFPVWARNTEDYDLVFFVANWPKVRVSAWDALLKARAIENMSYCIGVNRIGFDGNGHEYSGHSAAYDSLGKRLDTISSGQETTEVITLNKSHITKYREKLGFLKDRDRFTLE